MDEDGEDYYYVPLYDYYDEDDFEDDQDDHEDDLIDYAYGVYN